MDAYLAADLLGLKGKMNAFSINHQMGLGISTTRWSLKNSRKNRRTALVVGASGVPKLHSKTAVLALLTGGLPWVKGGSGRKGIVNKY